MTSRELFRPDWRDARAFAAALPEDNVAEEIRKAMLKNAKSTDGHRPDATELVASFRYLLGDLRLHDLGSCWYWGAMLALSFAYLLIELIVVGNAAATPTLVQFQRLILICVVGLAVLLLTYLAVVIRLFTGGSLFKWVTWIPPSIFHAVPVIWVSAFSLILNFYVVSQTGYGDSPYLTAFLASALVVLSLPRENSWPVILLAIMALTFGGLGAWRTSAVTPEAIAAWGGPELARHIALLTFLYSGISAVILRSIANHRVPAEQS